jgi:hypothetical protein
VTRDWPIDVEQEILVVLLENVGDRLPNMFVYPRG